MLPGCMELRENRVDVHPQDNGKLREALCHQGGDAVDADSAVRGEHSQHEDVESRVDFCKNAAGRCANAESEVSLWPATPPTEGGWREQPKCIGCEQKKQNSFADTESCREAGAFNPDGNCYGHKPGDQYVAKGLVDGECSHVSLAVEDHHQGLVDREERHSGKSVRQTRGNSLAAYKTPE